MIVKDPRVQLLITARPMTVVDIDLDRTRSLRILAHPEDMKLYLESQINHEKQLSRIIQRDPGLRGCIVDTIVSKANGMFLAAELHLASLASKNSLSKVRKSLETIPEDLDGVYDEAMLRIEAQNRDDLQLAESILSWITYAYRPLKLIELCHALAVEPEEDTLDPENMPDILTLVDICAGLVTIDESSGVIRLVHFTTQDYFQRLRITRFPQAQTYITKICLAYLLIKEFEDGCSLSEPELIARAKSFPFLTYAASFWARHMRSAEKGGLIDKDVREMALNLLKSKHPFANAYQADYWEKRRRFSSQVPIAAVPLHFAIAHGLTWIAQELIKDSPDVNAIGPHGLSALEIAVEYNNDPVIRDLLSSGALVRRTNISGQTLLYDAIIWESMTIAHLLIESAKGSGLKGKLWHATLEVALRDEDFRAIELLRDLVDPDIPVSPLLDEFLGELVSANQPRKPITRIVDVVAKSAHVGRADTKNLSSLLWGPEMGLDEGIVLFARTGKGLTLFSVELLQDLDFSILCELAGLSTLVLPKPDAEIHQVGLALSHEHVGNQADAAVESYRSDGTDTASLLVNSVLEYQERPFLLLHRLSGHLGEVWCTSFSHNGTMLAVSGKGGDIFIYNTSNYGTIDADQLDRNRHG